MTFVSTLGTVWELGNESMKKVYTIKVVTSKDGKSL